MKRMALVLAFLLPACGNSADEQAANGPPMFNNPDADVSGPAISVTGSSTVFPFTKAVAEAFAQTYPEAAVPTVVSSGTNAGIGEFCAGGAASPDIADASRRMTPEEFAGCAANGVSDIRELVIGMDGIVLVEAVPEDAAAPDAEETDAVRAPRLDLTRAQIYRALSATTPEGDANTARRWSDIDANLPDRAIRVIVPPETSGTRERFEEFVMVKGCREIRALADVEEARCRTLRTDQAVIVGDEDDKNLVAAVASNAEAIGVVGYSYLQQNPEQLEPISINRQVPDEATIMGGGYPASRRLYLYVNGQRFAEKPALSVFIDTFLSDEVTGSEGMLVDKGLVPVPIWNRDKVLQSRDRKLTAEQLDEA